MMPLLHRILIATIFVTQTLFAQTEEVENSIEDESNIEDSSNALQTPVVKHVEASDEAAKATLSTVLTDSATAAARSAGDALAVGGEVVNVLEDDGERPKDWVRTQSLSLGFGGSYTYNNNLMVGATPGSFVQFGGLSNALLRYRKGGHQLKFIGLWEEAMLYSPALGSLWDGNFQKSLDRLQFGTDYRYFFESLTWVGPYVRALLNAQVFPNWFLGGSDLTTTVPGFESYTAQNKIPLTNWFEPLTTELSFGAFFQPKQNPPQLTYFFRAGLKGQSILARGGYVNANDAATEVVEFSQLQSISSFGADLEFNANGVLDKNVLWGLQSVWYYPVITWYPTVESNLDFVDFLHWDIVGKISFRLNEYLSLDWVNRLMRQPFITREYTRNPGAFDNDWQVQTALLLSAGFNILE